MIKFGVRLTHDLDAKFGKPPKKTISQRDVPGMTRSAIPILLSANITAISIGANGGSTPANVPKAFIWHDPVSGKVKNFFFVFFKNKEFIKFK